MDERREPKRPASPAGEDAIVMFLLGPDGDPIEPGDAPKARTVADVVEAFRKSVEAEHIPDPFGRRRLGPRPVQGSGRPATPGYRDEIVVILRSAPTDAVIEAVTGRFLEPPLTRLRVDPTSLESRRFEVTWRATIRVAWWRRARRVRIRLYASPSLNVTAMAMSPIAPRRVARRRFLRVGSRVMNELARRLDDRIAAAVEGFA